MKGFSILGGALLVAALLSFFPVMRRWWQAFLSRPGPAIILLVTLVNTLLTTGKGADITAIQGGSVDPFRIIRAVLVTGLFIASSTQILKDLSRIRLAGSGAQWMIIYALLAMLSATYSISGFVSFWKGFEVMTLVLVAVSLANQLRTAEDLDWLLNVMKFLLFYLLLTIYVGLALYPGIAIKSTEYLGVRGIVPILNPASVGAISALLIVCTVAGVLYRWPSKKETAGVAVILAAAIGGLVLAHVRTPIVAVVAAVMVMFTMGKNYRAMGITALLGIILVLGMSLDDITSYIYRGQSHESLVGLTGRVQSWETMVWPLIVTSPLLGNGFYAAQRVMFNLNAIDNSYLEVVVGMGFLGLMVFLMPTLIAFKTILRTRPRRTTPMVNKLLWAQLMGLLTVLVVRGLAGSSYQVQHPLLVFYMLSQIGVAALLRLHFMKEPTRITTDRKEEKKESSLLGKRKHSILSTRRR